MLDNEITVSLYYVEKKRILLQIKYKFYNWQQVVY